MNKEINDYIENVFENMSSIFKDDLILEVCQVYFELVTRRQANSETVKDLLNDYRELLEDFEHYGHYTWISIWIIWSKINGKSVIDHTRDWVYDTWKGLFN